MHKSNILLLTLIFSFSALYAQSSKNIEVRVLLNSSKNYQISPYGQYVIVVNNKKTIANGQIKMSFHTNGILLNDKLLKTSKIDIFQAKGFSVNSKLYRGNFTVHREKSTLSLINKINLEEYLASVVPSEVYTSWNNETLKSQAVVARTYALYEISRRRKNKNSKFDVFDNTRSQVYKGVTVEHPKTTRAVLSTKGQVLTYNGALIKSYFSSSIGGISAAGYEIGDHKPYLQPVKAYYSKQNPNNTWSVRVPLKKIQQQYKTTQIKKIGVASRTSSGRIHQINIQDSRGKITKVRADHFREKIGHSKMKSTLAELDTKSGNLIIKGKGYGHGVGMGQWEAQELARRGAKYSQILRYFYQGAEIKQIY